MLEVMIFVTGVQIPCTLSRLNPVRHSMQLFLKSKVLHPIQSGPEQAELQMVRRSEKTSSCVKYLSNILLIL